MTTRTYEAGDPPVLVDLPQDWTSEAVDGATLAVVAPDVGAAFRPNLVVTTVATGELSLSRAVDELRQTLARLPEVAEVGAGERTVDGRAGYATEVTFRAPGGQVLVQTHWVTSVDGAVEEDALLVHLTGTCAAATAADDLPVLRHALATARLPGDR